jgi:hypothetical protein
MARTTTLALLRTAFRNRGEYNNSATMTDAMVLDFLNAAIAEVHNMLVMKSGDYFLTDTTIPTVANQDYIAMPADFFKLRALDLEVSSTEKYPLQVWPVEDRLRYRGTGRPTRYRVRGTGAASGTSARCVLGPTPNAIYTLRLHYYPAAVALSADADVYDGINGFEEAVLELALYRADKREGRPSTAERMAEYTRLMGVFTSAADQRDNSGPQHLVPVRGYYDADEDYA